MSEDTENFAKEKSEIKMIMHMYREMEKARERILNLFRKYGYEPSIFSYSLTMLLEVNGTTIAVRDGNKPTIEDMLNTFQ